MEFFKCICTIQIWFDLIWFSNSMWNSFEKYLLVYDSERHKHIAKWQAQNLIAACCLVTKLCRTLLWPHGLWPTRLLCPWDSSGKNTGVGCHFLLQCMKVKSESEVAQSCLTLGDPMDCSLPGSSVHGIFQSRVLEWGAIAFSAYRIYSLPNI